MSCINREFGRNDYFIPMNEWERLMLRKHAIAVKNYLKTIEDTDLRGKVHNAIQPLLKDRPGGNIELM